MTQSLPSPGPLLTDHLSHWAAHGAHLRAVTHIDFPTPASPGVHHTLTWQGLEGRARAVAGRIAGLARPGERAALLLPQGLDYVTAFLGCLYAGVVAVPLFDPGLPGHADRLTAVLDDCEPVCVLCDTASAAAVEEFTGGRIPLLAVDRPMEDTAADTPERPVPTARPAPDDVAYLQYTSGSTRTPAGVMITHANVVANARQALAATGAGRADSTVVGWLPLFHDMGLVLSVAAPVVGGLPSVLMDPLAFLEEPLRWLRLLGAYPGTISAAPNFAYDYCAARAGAGEAAGLELDRVRVLLNGSEPVRPGTVERFRAAFADAGLADEAQCPAYGLAEATVFVTTDPCTAPPTVVPCDAEALAQGRVEPSDGGTAPLVTCGVPAGQEVRVADPDTGAVLEEGRVGEIQVRGPNVGAGYWKRSELSAEVFGSGWLRTGDLGALHEGRLVVTGRLKDLIIADGRNHYPQDVEETVQSAVEAVRRDRLAAFAVPADSGAGEALVVVAEHRRGAAPSPAQERAAASAARTAVSARHGLRLAALLLVPPGSVPRTSSGKVARAACRERYLRGEIHSGAGLGSEDRR